MQMKGLAPALAAVAAVAAIGAGAAGAGTMHPVLGAKLAGMGEHGVVNFKSTTGKSSTGRLCWTFDLGMKGATGASIRDAHGMVVVRLGSSYAKKSCTAVKAAVLGSIDRRPSSFRVWVDTKGHPGDLRGTLFAGMADM
jgi:hypothetical protein